MAETHQKIAEARPKKEDLTKPLFLITVFSSLGSLQCGFNLWVVYSPSVLMQDFYNISFGKKIQDVKDADYTAFLTSITIAFFPLGGVLGSFVVGPLTDDYGRKGALLVNSVFSTISAVLLACSRVTKGYEVTMISRFAMGICSGIFYTAVPIYLSEVSPTSLRGNITLTPHFFVVLGVLVAQILALREVLGTQEGWPILMSLIGIPSLCQAIITFTFPESPRYLMIQKKDEEKARTVLKKLRNKEDVEDEIEELRQEDLAEKDEKQMNALKLLTCPDLQQQALNVMALACSQQLGGVNAAYFYTERIYIATKIGLDNVRFLSILSIATVLLVVFVMLHVVSLVERKTLLLIGFTICGFCGILLTVSIKYKDAVLPMSYLATIAVNLYLVGHAIGPSSLPNVLTAEMFLQSARSSAYVIEGFLYWALYFLTSVTYLHMQAKMRNYSFLVFVPFNVAAIIYVVKFIPKTNNKTFLEIRMAAQRIRDREPTEAPF